MKTGIITKPNQKGQIVIPKEYRDVLEIDSNRFLNLIIRGKGIYIYPITEVITKADQENSYLTILQKNKGSWQEKEWNKISQKRRKIELSASKKRKQVW